MRGERVLLWHRHRLRLLDRSQAREVFAFEGPRPLAGLALSSSGSSFLFATQEEPRQSGRRWTGLLWQEGLGLRSHPLRLPGALRATFLPGQGYAWYTPEGIQAWSSSGHSLPFPSFPEHEILDLRPSLLPGLALLSTRSIPGGSDQSQVWVIDLAASPELEIQLGAQFPSQYGVGVLRPSIADLPRTTSDPHPLGSHLEWVPLDSPGARELVRSTPNRRCWLELGSPARGEPDRLFLEGPQEEIRSLPLPRPSRRRSPLRSLDPSATILAQVQGSKVEFRDLECEGGSGPPEPPLPRLLPGVRSPQVLVPPELEPAYASFGIPTLALLAEELGLSEILEVQGGPREDVILGPEGLVRVPKGLGSVSPCPLEPRPSRRDSAYAQNRSLPFLARFDAPSQSEIWAFFERGRIFLDLYQGSRYFGTLERASTPPDPQIEVGWISPGVFWIGDRTGWAAGRLDSTDPAREEAAPSSLGFPPRGYLWSRRGPAPQRILATARESREALFRAPEGSLHWISWIHGTLLPAWQEPPAQARIRIAKVHPSGRWIFLQRENLEVEVRDRFEPGRVHSVPGPGEALVQLENEASQDCLWALGCRGSLWILPWSELVSRARPRTSRSPPRAL